jgi:hypothetical protein
MLIAVLFKTPYYRISMNPNESEDYLSLTMAKYFLK